MSFPADVAGVRLVAFARQGIYHGVRALGLGRHDQVLVPAYHHGSEVEAMRRAGLGVVFYGAVSPLVPDENELESLITREVRALHIIHYFGFPQESQRWRRWCDRHGLLLIEDAAQAWLATEGGRAVGSAADLAVFCLYKTLPLAEGAFVVARADLPPPPANRSPGVAALVREHAAWAAQHSPIVSALAERVSPPRPYDVNRDFALDDLDAAPPSTTRLLLRRLAASTDEAAAVRRTNYALLSQYLDEQVPEPVRIVPSGASPFVFPLLAADKSRLLAHLRSAGVRALDFWSVPHPSLPLGRFPQVDALRRSVIGLPVHQQLPYGEVVRVARAVSRRAAERRVTVELLEDLDSAERPWRELAEASPNPFATFEWAACWLRHHESDGPVLLGLCVARGGRAAALLPLQRTNMLGVRMLRFIGADPADIHGPVCSPADSVLAGQGLRELLRRTDRWDLWLGDRLPTGTGWDRLVGGQVLRRESSPVLVFPPGGWQEFLGSRSANFRQQLRRRERALFRHHDAAYRLSDSATVESDMETLFALHAKRWGADTPFLADRAVHLDFAKVAQQRGWLRLWLLEVDGDAVAAWYGFRYADQEWYYQAGRDPVWAASGVGGILLAHTMRAAADDGARVYRLLRGDEEYKARYATEEDWTVAVASANGSRGAAALAAAATLSRLPAAARRPARLLVERSRRSAR